MTLAEQKITPFLWFDGKAEEATNFYVSVFKNSTVVGINRGGGGVVSTSFVLEGQRFYALNGGPMYQFSPAISFFVSCTTQLEVDALWEALSDGGSEQRCGWLKDKFGVSWQIIPTALGRLMGDQNPAKAGAVAQAMLAMTKIDIKGLQQAYDEA
jgi:predicted 3-demethylubiquinone-9 3-methyltransferase (glyoxalase superfamily)